MVPKSTPAFVKTIHRARKKAGGHPKSPANYTEAIFLLTIKCMLMLMFMLEFVCVYSNVYRLYKQAISKLVNNVDMPASLIELGRQ